MTSFCKTNALLIASELYFLRQTWVEIKKADDVINDPNLFKEIDESLEKLTGYIKEIEEDILNGNLEDARTTLNLSISSEYSNCMELFGKIELKGIIFQMKKIFKKLAL